MYFDVSQKSIWFSYFTHSPWTIYGAGVYLYREKYISSPDIDAEFQVKIVKHQLGIFTWLPHRYLIFNLSRTGCTFVLFLRLLNLVNENNKYWQWYGEIGTLVPCWWKCKLVLPLWKRVWWFLKKLKMGLLYDLAILLWGIYSKGLKVETQADVCTPMFTAALFTVAKSRSYSKCPSMDEWD